MIGNKKAELALLERTYLLIIDLARSTPGVRIPWRVRPYDRTVELLRPAIPTGCRRFGGRVAPTGCNEICRFPGRAVQTA